VGEIERDTIFVGGEDMTQHLMKILGGEERGWGRDMAEQLKCSSICEILDGSKVNIPGQGTEKISDLVKKGKKLGKDINVSPTEEDDDDGTPNVAAIVASGKTREYLEKKEKEKQEAAKGAKNLPNWRRDTNKFWVIEKRKPGEVIDVEMADHWEQTEYREEKPDEPMADFSAPPAPPLEKPTSTNAPQAPSRPGTSSGALPGSRPSTSSGVPPPGSRPGTSAGPADGEPESEEARLKAEAKEKRKEEKRAKNLQEVEQIQLRSNEYRREVEVGIERFQAAEGGIITTIADAMYRIIMRVDDLSRRQELWDSLVVVGNASRVKGKWAYLLPILKPALVANESPRLQRFSPPNPHREIQNLPLLRQHVHLRASLLRLHPDPHRRLHPDPRSWPLIRCKPTPCSSHHQPPPPGRRATAFLAFPQPNEYEIRKGTRVFPRVERCGVRGSDVFGGAGRGEGGVCGGSGYE